VVTNATDVDPNALTGDALMTYVTAKITGTISQANDPMGENCLGLNIWTKPQIGEKKKAVLLWIYGGGKGSAYCISTIHLIQVIGYSTGATSTKAYNGALLAEEQDVVVVSVKWVLFRRYHLRYYINETCSYRVNVFGFSGDPGLSEFNAGLRDQRLATVWLRDNIANFGGDPERITLFGQSAGGGSVDIYSHAWTDDPIVHGFIPQSGTALMISKTQNEALKTWYKLSNALGCGDEKSNSTTLECMRSIPWEVIRNSTASLGFGPIHDEKVVFANYTAQGELGKFIKKVSKLRDNLNAISPLTSASQCS
jgi:cholinesterase